VVGANCSRFQITIEIELLLRVILAVYSLYCNWSTVPQYSVVNYPIVKSNESKFGHMMYLVHARTRTLQRSNSEVRVQDD
jgi:hypothetical protein